MFWRFGGKGLLNESVNQRMTKVFEEQPRLHRVCKICVETCNLPPFPMFDFGAFKEKRKKIWHVTCDMWQVKRDMWHVTCDVWHVTCCGGWAFSQNFSSLALTIWEWKCFEDILSQRIHLTKKIINGTASFFIVQNVVFKKKEPKTNLCF